VPSAFALLRLAEVANESLDWLCGRDVPEKVGVSRSAKALGEDLRVYLIDGLVARGVPRAIAEEHLYPPAQLLADILHRADEYAFRSSVDDEIKRVSMERVRARWDQEARQAEAEEDEAVERLVQEQSKTPRRVSGQRPKGK
jgi:hypothetical protein